MAEADTTVTETTTPEVAASPTLDTTDTSTVLGGDAPKDPPADLKPEGGDPAAETPVVPEVYELTAPEGFSLDAAMMEMATPIFKEAGLTNEQAQKILPAAAKFAEGLKTQGEQQLLGHVMAERKAWAAEAQADPEIGGAHWNETVAMSAKALDALPENVGAPLRSLLNDSGLGNKREMIAAMAFFGRAVGEDSAIRGDGAATTTVPTAHKLYPNDVPKGG